MTSSQPAGKRTVPRDFALQLLRRIGAGDRVDEARAALPDPVDLDQDATVLARFGLTRDHLYSELGGSP